MSSAARNRLVQATISRDATAVRDLLGAGVEPNAPNDEGTLPLYAAAVAGDATIAHDLLGAGADANRESTGPGEGTSLCAAACWGYDDVVTLLLDHGADPNLLETRDLTMSPLDYAVGGLHLTTARMLLEAGSDPNRKGRDVLPLHVAADRGSAMLVRMLLDHGADPGAVDDDGETAVAAAERWIGKDVVATLRDRLRGVREQVVEVQVQREPRPGGSELVTVVLDLPGGGSGTSTIETGHAEVVKLLRGR
jgi:ankyrin repeat protein